MKQTLSAVLLSGVFALTPVTTLAGDDAFWHFGVAQSVPVHGYSHRHHHAYPPQGAYCPPPVVHHYSHPRWYHRPHHYYHTYPKYRPGSRHHWGQRDRYYQYNHAYPQHYYGSQFSIGIGGSLD